jgi:MoxR-like ATPase
MPADIVGSMIMENDDRGAKRLQFQHGPIFAHLVLADEINRATPKTQSALLEAMQERTVTSGNTTHELEMPFLVMATQNPIEMEGTYPLPEAQVDRFFFKLLLEYPGRAELARIADLTASPSPAELNRVLDGETILKIRDWVREVPIAAAVKDYAARLILATHPHKNGREGSAEKYVLYGASPRGLQSLVLAAKARALLDERPNVSFEDIRAVAPQSLRHRIILNLEGDAEGVTAEQIVAEVIAAVPEIEA